MSAQAGIPKNPATCTIRPSISPALRRGCADVDTKDTVVFIDGVVGSRSERAQPITIANHTRGVTLVKADQLIVR